MWTLALGIALGCIGVIAAVAGVIALLGWMHRPEHSDWPGR